MIVLYKLYNNFLKYVFSKIYSKYKFQHPCNQFAETFVVELTENDYKEMNRCFICKKVL